MKRREFIAGAAGMVAVTASGGSTAIPAPVHIGIDMAKGPDVTAWWVSNPHSDTPQREKPAPA